MLRVAVIGGGLSGLATARAVLDEAQRRSMAVELAVFEKDRVVGGKIRSTRTDGFLCEEGPNGFLDNKPATLALVERLGAGERLLKSNDGARKRFVYTGGRLRALPEDPVSFLLSDILSIRGKLRLAAEALLPQGEGDDETVAAFVRRRLGDEVLDKLIDPMSAGIYAGDPGVMSLQSSFPKVAEIERQFGGLLRGMLAMQKRARAAGREGPKGAGPGGVLWSFREGTAELIDRLADSLPTDALRVDTAAVELTRRGAQWDVGTGGGQTFCADRVVLAAPAYAVAPLLGPHDERLTELLYSIPYVPAAVVCTGFRADDLPTPLDGFGYLIPTSEKRRILGSLWSSSIFSHRAPDGSVLTTQIVGGARNPELVALDDDDLSAVVRAELAEMLGILAEPSFVKIARWERAIPQYVVGHGERVAQIEQHLERLGGVFLASNAYYGIGINDCTARAVHVAPRVVS